MMNELQPVITEFKNNHLNEIGAELISLSKDTNNHLTQAKQHVKSAILNRWNRGRIIAENIDEILDECGTQRKFSERIGLTEAMISNDKRGYLACKEAGAETEEEFLNLLSQKQIPARTDRWEKLPKLLNDPDSRKNKQQKSKDEKRVQDLWQEAEEIEQRQLNQNKTLSEEASQVKRHIEHLHNALKKQNPINVEWEKEGYLEYIRTYGKDMLTDEAVSPDERLQPHHINPFTGEASGGVGNKLADVWTIPVLADTHSLDHSKDSPFTLQDYKDALLKVMATFIIENY